jgi:hypothetical protein
MLPPELIEIVAEHYYKDLAEEGVSPDKLYKLYEGHKDPFSIFLLKNLYEYDIEWHTKLWEKKCEIYYDEKYINQPYFRYMQTPSYDEKFKEIIEELYDKKEKYKRKLDKLTNKFLL